LCWERGKYIHCQGRKEKKSEFIEEQLRKEYIRPLKLSQTALMFFVEKKKSKKRMIQDYRYLNK